jgi:copper chaperone CopZ
MGRRLFFEVRVVRTCWQIRQALRQSDAPGSGKNGWVITCSECAIYDRDRSCWEQHSGGPACCAPLDVTCDFCKIYIEHRREIADMIWADNRFAPECVNENSHLEGGVPLMDKLQLNVPGLWADHHTLKVRDVLTQMAGVQDVVASSAFRMVALSYDPAVTSPGAVMAALEDADYPVATDGTGVITETVPVADGRRDPAWTRLGMRQIKTDERDLKTKR